MNLRESIEGLNPIKIKKEVSKDYEAANVMNAFNDNCVLFENIKGFPGQKFVSGLCSKRENFALGLGMKKEDMLKKTAEALKNPVEPEVVSSGNCYEVEEKDLNSVPIPRYFRQDGGPYLSSAVVVINDPELGRNVCYHRLMQLDDKHFTARIIENRGTYNALQKTGELEATICIGNSIPVLLAASLSAAPDQDEFSVANALSETKLVKCKSVDLHVPVETEWIIEAKITSDMGDEGPFVDLTETRDFVRQQNVWEVKKVFHRKNPVMHMLLPGKYEHKMLMGMPKEPTIYNAVNEVTKCKNVLITPGGANWLHAVVQIEKQGKEDGLKAGEAAFKGHKSLKHCVVVDEDINIYDPNKVEWAIATRVQSDKDVKVVSDQPASSLDPSAKHEAGKKSLSAKAWVDATKKGGKDFELVNYDPVKKEEYL